MVINRHFCIKSQILCRFTLTYRYKISTIKVIALSDISTPNKITQKWNKGQTESTTTKTQDQTERQKTKTRKKKNKKQTKEIKKGEML